MKVRNSIIIVPSFCHYCKQKSLLEGRKILTHATLYFSPLFSFSSRCLKVKQEERFLFQKNDIAIGHSLHYLHQTTQQPCTENCWIIMCLFQAVSMVSVSLGCASLVLPHKKSMLRVNFLLLFSYILNLSRYVCVINTFIIHLIFIYRFSRL